MQRAADALDQRQCAERRAGRAGRARPRRRGAGDGRRPRLCRIHLQPRDPGGPPAGLGVQAVRLSGRARSGLHARRRSSTSRSTIDGWSPRNSSGRYAGRDPAAHRLRLFDQHGRGASSAQEVGFGAVADMARRFGITTPVNTHPSMVLGTTDVRLIDMTRALPRSRASGVAVTPYGIRKVTTADGDAALPASGRRAARAGRALGGGADDRPAAVRGQHRHRPRGADRPAGRGQDRHDQFQQGRLVHRLFERPHHRRLDGPRRCKRRRRPAGRHARRPAPSTISCASPSPAARSRSSRPRSTCPTGSSRTEDDAYFGAPEEGGLVDDDGNPIELPGAAPVPAPDSGPPPPEDDGPILNQQWIEEQTGRRPPPESVPRHHPSTGRTEGRSAGGEGARARARKERRELASARL